MARALVQRDMGRFDEALRTLAYAQQLLPGDAEVVIQQALTYGSMDKLPDAVRLLRQALAIDTENVNAGFWLSYFLLHRRRFREAFDAAERLLEITPESLPAYLLRGVALHGLRRHRQAEDDLARVRAGEPGLLAAGKPCPECGYAMHEVHATAGALPLTVDICSHCTMVWFDPREYDALRHGLARALVQFDESLRKTLREHGMLTRDPRVKERKKYGRKRARRGFQFSKR